MITTFIKTLNELFIHDPHPQITGKIKEWNSEGVITRFDTILTFKTDKMCAIVETDYILEDKGLIEPTDIIRSIADGKSHITQITLFNREV